MSPTLAYLMIFIVVTGHASSEFFAVLSGVKDAEVSVWRYVIGAAGLLIVALARPDTRDLWTPLKAEWKRLVAYSIIGISLAYLAFHWALDYASIVQVGTVVTTIPIFVGLINLIATWHHQAHIRCRRSNWSGAVTDRRLSGAVGKWRHRDLRNISLNSLCGAGFRLHGSGQADYHRIWDDPHHHHQPDHRRCGPLDHCWPVLEYLG
jgi:hypothetical protein